MSKAENQHGYLSTLARELARFVEAYEELKHTWSCEYRVDIDANDFLAKDYPNNLPSFDEINFAGWKETSLELLNERIAFLKAGIIAHEKILHTKDGDCTVDGSGVCIFCSVHHDEPCLQCNGKGFHADWCSQRETIKRFESVPTRKVGGR